MRSRSGLAIALLMVWGVPGPVGAQRTPVQLGFLAPLQVFPEEHAVHGLRLALFWADNAEVVGLDLSLVETKVQGSARGVQLAPLNDASSDVTGLQVALGNGAGGILTGLQIGAANVAASGRGVQIAALGNRAGRTSEGRAFRAGAMQGGQISLLNQGSVVGLQLGLANAGSENGGVQLGLLNLTQGLAGAQLTGLVNHATRVRGFQLGVLNFAREELTGVQIGLLNFNPEGFLPFFPILSFSLD